MLFYIQSNACVKFSGAICESDAGEDALADLCTDIEEYPIEIHHSKGTATSTRCFVAVNLRPPREVPKTCVMRLEAIGRGAFGEVYRGLLQVGTVLVAAL